MGRPTLRAETKASLSSALAGSKLRYNAQAWLPLERKARAQHWAAEVDLARSAGGCRRGPGDNISDQEALSRGGHLVPAENITIARLSFSRGSWLQLPQRSWPSWRRMMARRTARG